MRLSNTNAPEQEYGSIVWYLDKNTRNILYAIDGEDNKEYYSYNAIKVGKLASPEHICHYDLWFTNQYPFAQIQGISKLRDEYEPVSFDSKQREITQKADKWRDTVLAGKISPDGKKFLSFSASETKPIQELKTIFNFFAKKKMILDSTEFYFNNNYEGNVLELFPDIKKTAMSVIASEDQATLDLINQFKTSANPEEKKTAGDKLFEKYEKLILGIWHRFLSKYSLQTNSAEAQDALSDAQYEFLNNILNFDPNKEKLSTYIYNSISFTLMNFFNTKRNKGLNSEINMPHHKSDTGGEGMSFDIMNQNREPGVNEYNNKEYIEKLLSQVPERERKILEGYFFDNKTYDQIGQEMGVTRERVRQLINSAIELLRKNPDTKILNKEDKQYNHSKDVLENLPRKLYDIMYKYTQENKNPRQIAEELGYSTQKVMELIKQADDILEQHEMDQDEEGIDPNLNVESIKIAMIFGKR